MNCINCISRANRKFLDYERFLAAFKSLSIENNGTVEKQILSFLSLG